MRKVVLLLQACLCLAAEGAAQSAFANLPSVVKASSAVPAQDTTQTVIQITELKLLGLGVEGKFGTGFCIDRKCRFIGTNYHVAMLAQPGKIKGDRVIQRYLATGREDEGATVNEGPSIGPLKYNLSRDLAIFELRHPLRPYHGVAFSLDDLQIGQEFDIYAYPKESSNPICSLLRLHGSYGGGTTAGLLAFDYTFSPGGKPILRGPSGGIVVDSKTQRVVGVLNAIAMNRKAVALAVPVRSLAEFVGKTQPYLAHSIFPSIKTISPVSADIYPHFVAPPK